MLGFDTEASEKYSAIAAPIDIAGNRNGTLFMYRVSKPYSIDDIILAEYATTVVGLEIVRSKNEESAAVLRGQKVAESAFASLSVMEAEAVRQVFDELQGTEGILVTSRVADKARITRSVIVNALRKLESAGVIESRSSGMKGTYIKVLNDNIFAFLTPDQQ
jgi:transcriptional pleiotropic repressor